MTTKTEEETTMEHEGWAPASFNHPKNIEIGKGRVIWAQAAVCTSGLIHPEGWCLPGGERTNNRARADAVAQAIDELSRGAA